MNKSVFLLHGILENRPQLEHRFSDSCFSNLVNYRFFYFYPQGNVVIKGIKKLTIFSRRVALVCKRKSTRSKRSEFVPAFRKSSTGADGVNGKHGANGTTSRCEIIGILTLFRTRVAHKLRTCMPSAVVCSCLVFQFVFK